MTIDEAIKHCEEVAWENDKKAMCVEEAYQTTEQQNCEQCAADHRQLAEWLTELKEAKRLLKSATNVLKRSKPCDGDYDCSECIHQRRNCDYDDRFKWRYTDEALKLIGGRRNDTDM